MSLLPAILCAFALAGNGEETLATLPDGRYCSWVPQNTRVEKSSDLLRVTADVSGETAVSVGGRRSPTRVTSGITTSAANGSASGRISTT